MDILVNAVGLGCFFNLVFNAIWSLDKMPKFMFRKPLNCAMCFAAWSAGILLFCFGFGAMDLVVSMGIAGITSELIERKLL